MKTAQENIPVIIPFQFNANEIRVIQDENGESWFVARDVCGILGLSNVSEAVSRLDDDEKSDIILNDAAGRPNRLIIVSEPGLYSLMGDSRKPEVKPFKRWINHDVIPSIRKTGEYALPAVQEKNRQPSLTTKCTTAKILIGTYLEVGQMLGTELAMARAIAVSETKKVAGIDFTPLLVGNAVEAAPLTATELGKLLGMTARQVNEALSAVGLQTKEDKDWKPTEKGKELCTVNPYKSEHSQHTGYRILWKPETAERIKEAGNGGAS